MIVNDRVWTQKITRRNTEQKNHNHTKDPCLFVEFPCSKRENHKHNRKQKKHKGNTILII